MDDIEILRRKRAIKVILTDIFMALSVVAIVFILVAAVAGWRINSDLSFEQNGLVSLRTKPTGAEITIDGKKESSLTNTSKMLPGGTHKIELAKEGYIGWEKEVKVTPGWLLRLEYPKLFKKSREKVTIGDFETLEFFHVSDNRASAILAEKKTTEWVYVTDFNGTPKFKKIDIRGIFSGTENGEFPYEIESIEWSENNERILVKTAGENGEWGIINLKNIKDSINLTTDYARFEANSDAIGATEKTADAKIITSAKFENEVGDKVIAIVNNNLIRIDTAGKIISTALAEKVVGYNMYDSSVVYLTTFEEGKREIRFLHLGEKNPITLQTITDENAKVTYNLTNFNSINYIIYTVDSHLYAYRAKDLPTPDTKFSINNIINKEIETSASTSEVSFNNEFIILRDGSKVTVFDAEIDETSEYDYVDNKTRFLDNYIMYRVDNNSGELLAWDFDGTNVRMLVSGNATSAYDAFISANDRYFYYIEKLESGFSLVQEKLN